MQTQDCGECGEEDCEPDFVECCAVWMCDRCQDRHDLKHPRPEPEGPAEG